MRKRYIKSQQQINIIPLLDVLLVLLAVLALSVETIKIKSLVINLPQVKQYSDMPPSTSISISLTESGLFFNGKKILRKDLQALLNAKIDKNTVVQIEGDSMAKYDKIVALIEIVRKANFKNVSLLTRQNK